MFLNAATMYILYVAVKRIFNSFIGLTAAAVYGIMAVGIVFYGFSAHATHFICFYTALALLFFTNYIKSGKVLPVFIYGLMLGMAFLMKQQAVFLVATGGLTLLFYIRNVKKESITDILKKLFVFGSGVAIPYIVVLLIVVSSGQFHSFWLWTIEYASKYESASSDPYGMFTSTFGAAWTVYFYFWLLALGGLIFLFVNKKYSSFQKTFSILLLVGSAAAVSAGLYFRQHYFIVLLPVIGLLTAICLQQVLNLLQDKVDSLKSINTGLVLLSVILAFSLYSNKEYLFSDSPKAIGSITPENPFVPAVEISRYIKDNSSDTDKIAVFGSEPEIYFYSGRIAATSFLYTYPLMEKQPYNLAMQEEMIAQIEKAKPKYIVYCNITPSWVSRDDSPKKIFEWGQQYTGAHYTIAGFAGLQDDNQWNISLGDNVTMPTSQPKTFMLLFKWSK